MVSTADAAPRSGVTKCDFGIDRQPLVPLDDLAGQRVELTTAPSISSPNSSMRRPMSS